MSRKKQLRALKKRMKWTNPQIAVHMGVSESAVNGWFYTAKTDITVNNMRLLEYIANDKNIKHTHNNP